MARKTQITKDVILEASFQMLLREGYDAINITTLAKEIGCSTQPIAWQFGSMDGLREELLQYCLTFLKDKFTIEGEDAEHILEKIAEHYVDMALDYPNLYKYIYMSERDGKMIGQVTHDLRADNYAKMVQILAQEKHITEEAAERYIINLQLYVHGIASYIVSRFSFMSKDVAMQMIHEAQEAFLAYAKKDTLYTKEEDI